MSNITPGTPAESDQVRILRTGEWWTNSWFLDPRVHAALGVTECRVTAALERIRYLFPAPWYVEEERKLAAREEWHQALRLLGTGGTMGIGCLLELAEVLDSIEGARKGAPGLRSRLLTAEEFSGAMAEGRIARLLRAAGLPYSFEGRVGNDGPTHDLTVHAEPIPFCIEVTRVLNKWDEGPIALLTNRVMHALTTGLTGRNFGVEVDSDLVQFLPALRTDRLPEDLRFDFMLAGWLADRFIARILEEASKNADEFAIEESKVGRARVSAVIPAPDPEHPPGTQGGLQGPPIDPRTMVRKVVVAVLDKATRQLPRDRPGIVALSVPFGSLDMSFAETVLQSTMVSGGAHLEHLSGVLFSSSVAGPEGLVITLNPVENPNARVGIRSIPWTAVHKVSKVRCY